MNWTSTLSSSKAIHSPYIHTQLHVKNSKQAAQEPLCLSRAPTSAMEGVVLVEKLSGALVFTRSFTDAFDLRHPRSERMNLSALLFALLNFAGASRPRPCVCHAALRPQLP